MHSKLWTKCTIAAAIAAGLMNTCQTGCATSSGHFTHDPVVIENKPPEELITPCEQPEPGDIDRNGELLDLLIVTADAFNKCAAKVDAIRKFYKGE